MSSFRQIDLDGLTAGQDLEFVQAVVPDHHSPLAVVYYRVSGDPAEFGLRLDIEKQWFLDLPEGTDTDPNTDDAAKRVAAAVYENLAGAQAV